MNRRQLFAGLGAVALAGPSVAAIAAPVAEESVTTIWMDNQLVWSVETGFVETRAFQIETICRWFGVPPELLDHDVRMAG